MHNNSPKKTLAKSAYVSILKIINKLIIVSFLALGYQTASAESLLQTFGSGTANEFKMQFVKIGNPGNQADTSGAPISAGAVASEYNMGKYEVSRGMIEKANAAGLLGVVMQDMFWLGGNGTNRPATGITWTEAAKFVNYLNRSQGHQEAYDFNANGTFQLWNPEVSTGNNRFRHKNAHYFLPSTDEWYKAAYGDSQGHWYNYPNGTDTAPGPTPGGLLDDTAVHGLWASANSPADVNYAGGLSKFGTMAQGGNAWELLESAFDGTNNIAGENTELRGGGWNDPGTVFFGDNLISTKRFEVTTSREEYWIGFRVASVPEPSTGLLVLLGLSGLLLKRRK